MSDVALSPIEKAIWLGNSFVLIKYSIKYHFIEVHHTFMSKVILHLKSFFPLQLSRNSKEGCQRSKPSPRKTTYQKNGVQGKQVVFSPYSHPSSSISHSHLIPLTIARSFSSPHSHKNSLIFTSDALTYFHGQKNTKTLCLPSTCYCSQYLSQSHVS